jgi:hypothetical protein
VASGVLWNRPQQLQKSVEGEMSLAITLALIAVLIALIVMARRNRSTTSKRPPLSGRDVLAKTGSQYHAVSLQFSDSACEAAKALEGKRFLSGAAPRIPLPECDVQECKCRFIHHDDRRHGVDRRGAHSQSRIGDTGRHEKERRHRGDRRDDDPEDFFS